MIRERRSGIRKLRGDIRCIRRVESIEVLRLRPSYSVISSINVIV